MHISPEVLELTRRMVAGAPPSIALLDRDLRYLATSRAWLSQYGGGRSSVDGLLHYEVVPDIPQRWKDILQRALQGERLHEDEDVFERASGERSWLRWSVEPWLDPSGSVGGIVISSEDITAQKQLEQELKESEQRYRTLVETAPDAVIVHRDRKIVLANPAACALLGSTRVDELLGRPIWDVLDPQIHALARERMEAVESGNLLPSGTFTRVRRLDGELRDAEITASAATMGGHRVLQIVVRDVTAERAASRAAEETAARLAAVLGSALDAILAIDDEMKIVLANPAAERLFGYRTSELIGRSISTLVPERFRAAHMQRMREFGNSGSPSKSMGNGSIWGLHADGHEIPLEGSISRVVVGGKPIFTVIHRDVRPRLAAEEALRTSEERFRQLTEAIREVFWLTDIEKNQVLYVSPAYDQIFGRRADELYANPRAWLEAIHEADRPAVLQAALRQAEGGYDIEYRVVRPDGSVRWVHDRAFPVRDATGKVVRIAGVAEDVTERRGLEGQLRQTQKLESVGRLAGGIAHDFNNLLTVILYGAQTLRESDDLSPEDAPLVRDLLEAATRGAALTRQLLAFSRQEVNEPRVVDLGTVVLDAEKLLRRLIGEDIALSSHLDSASVPVSIDPSQWTQVLFNLAVNARDAMPRGGKLFIATDAIVVGAHGHPQHRELAPGRYARLTFTDSGTGMTPEVCARIFDPFFTTKPIGQGTGLGLPVVYGVVTQANGHISVSSELGVGTTFEIFVPASGEAPVPIVDVAPPRPKAGHETLLVVEDEESVRRVVSRVLQSSGYRVLLAEDAKAARALFAQHRDEIDMLVTDVIMPGDDGPTLARALRQEVPSLPVLFTSGYLGDSVEGRGIAPENLLQKPYSPAVLSERVRRMLDQKKG